MENPRDSLFGKASAAIAPVLAPAEFGDWETAGALVTGFVAKEVVVGTMNQIYVGGAEEEEAEEPTTFLQDLGGIATGFWNATVDTVKMTVSIIPGVNLVGEEEEEEETALTTALQGAFTPLSALAFTVFVLLYIPCMVAVAAQRQEYGIKWTAFSAAYLTGLGWVVRDPHLSGWTTARVLRMLMHLLSQIADGNTLSRSELSRRLKISNELLEQMLLDLSRIGYIESVDDTCTASTSKCTHCPFSGECSSINSGNRWTLTRRGHPRGSTKKRRCEVS